jgi:superoxide dismutase, Fe-Mn family
MRTRKDKRNTPVPDRRRFLTAAAIGIASSAFSWRRLAFAAAPPRETGLSFEGLLKDEPGFQPRTLAPLPVQQVPGFLSKAQLEANYNVYRSDFAKLLDAERALSQASRDAAHAREYAAIRREQLLAGNSVLMHEFYFRNLTGTPAPPSHYVMANMSEHMGSLESWREDFAACARVAGAWAALVYDPYDDRWHNVALDDADAGGWVGSNPLVVCDVADHAWSKDYKDRDTYVARFLDHIDWNVVARRYRMVDRH